MAVFVISEAIIRISYIGNHHFGIIYTIFLTKCSMRLIWAHPNDKIKFGFICRSNKRFVFPWFV